MKYNDGVTFNPELIRDLLEICSRLFWECLGKMRENQNHVKIYPEQAQYEVIRK